MAIPTVIERAAVSMLDTPNLAGPDRRNVGTPGCCI
ncbi:MAG: hypothetical protein ACJAQ3_003132, partial [Planctomycetota bacterium]